MGRDLTIGEVWLAREIYANSIDYMRVKVHNGKAIFVQSDNSGMTPRGEIYMSGNAYRDNYAVEDIDMQGFFIHEMAHVWQYQNKILNPVWAAIGEFFEHGFNYSRAYFYLLEANKTLIDYDIEQQASIIQDYFCILKRGTVSWMGHIQNAGTPAEITALFRAVLADFLANPSLPNRRR